MKTSRILGRNRCFREQRESFFQRGVNFVKDSCLRVNYEEHELHCLFGVTGIPQGPL